MKRSQGRALCAPNKTVAFPLAEGSSVSSRNLTAVYYTGSTMYDKRSITQRVRINLFHLLGNIRSHRSCCLNVFDLRLKPPHRRLADRPARVALYYRIPAKLFSEAVEIHGCLLTCMEGISFLVCLFCPSRLSVGSSHSQRSLLPGAFHFCLHKSFPSVSFAFIIWILMPNIKKE